MRAAGVNSGRADPAPSAASTGKAPSPSTVQSTCRTRAGTLPLSHSPDVESMNRDVDGEKGFNTVMMFARRSRRGPPTLVFVLLAGVALALAAKYGIPRA